MPKVYLGIGANLGDRERTLKQAVRALAEEPGLELLAASKVYETDPVCIEDQPRFLNAVLLAETELAARDLLDLLLSTEQRFGRVRERKWGPRTLDLDVLLYGDQIIHEEALEVPHPHMHERGFVLVPLCDLNPDSRHPVLGRRFSELAEAAAGEGVVPVDGLSLYPPEQEG
jgi:2-amino-4-hydroxy-6-hydroxymethyldihydropteridine diphosphokinase